MLCLPIRLPSALLTSVCAWPPDWSNLCYSNLFFLELHFFGREEHLRASSSLILLDFIGSCSHYCVIQVLKRWFIVLSGLGSSFIEL